MTRPPPELDECAYCDQPIRKFYPYTGASGVWMHIDGRHAYTECRDLNAKPKETESDGKHGKHHLSAVQDDQLQPKRH